ncbi:MAG TPA: tetratricopeptide repeat protein [Polyangiaceae bacterium]|nr:tetratricopeptide repeat protein [Polyangiaceae bacterium]
MTSVPPKSEAPKTEAKRRGVSVLAVKLWEVAEQLNERLDDASMVLELLVSAIAKGEVPIEAWEKLHRAAVRHEKISDLAMAYEQVATDKRIKLLTGEQQAFIYLRAAEFFQAELGDMDGAITYAERAAAAVPGHPEAFAMLERLYGAADKTARLAELYVDASSRAQQADVKLQLLRRAAELLKDPAQGDDLAITVGQSILKLAPGDESARESVVRRLLAKSRHKEVADVFEQALKREPPASPEEALLLREQLVDLCLNALKDVTRALGHIEGVLELLPNHPTALAAAEALLENRTYAPRAAAALSDAYERSGRTDRAIAMLSFELKNVRGPRRVEVQRRLGILRQDVLLDHAGALELLGPVVAGNPGDDDLRSRFVALSLALGQPEQAARLLARALSTSKDNAVRARVGADVGHVYLKSGDVKRAKLAFQQVLDLAERGPATLVAARELCELCTEAAEAKQLIAALTLVVELEPEREPRQAAARRLARMCDGEVKDTERAIVAYRALIGSPWTDEALRRLETMYREAGDEDGLAEMLFHRAERTKDPEEARTLAFSAAELATEKGRNVDGAIELWEKLMERFGASPELHRRLLPLLVQAKRFFEVCELVEQEITWAAETDRPKLYMDLAELRMTKLGDPEGALRAYQEALVLDPGHRGARGAVEKLLNQPETRELAAEILEPVLRREQPSTLLLRVLEVRADLAPTVQEKLAILRDATAISVAGLHDPEGALEISGAGLGIALRECREELGDWLSQTMGVAQHGGSAAHRAAVLNAALGNAVVDAPEVFELAKVTGEAYAAAGDLERAVETLRRAQQFDPSSRELLARIDHILAEQGAPEERLGLYQSALQQEQDPTRRRELLHALASLQSRELGAPQSAAVTLRQALAEDPRDRAAHESLLELLGKLGDLDGLSSELCRAVEQADGERKTLALLRLAELSEQRGNGAEALRRYRELLDVTDLADDVLGVIEQLARDQNDGLTVRLTLERRLSRTADLTARAALLERLGNAYAWQLSDPTSAARAWLEGAEIAERLPAELDRARRMYERVLSVDASSARAAGRLVELAARAGEWEQVREAFEVVLPTLEERDLVTLLLGLEERAQSSGAGAAYVQLVELALGRGLHPGRARHLGLAKARALASDPDRAGEAAKLFRQLVEQAGEDAAQELESFAEFLDKAEATAARAKDYRWMMNEAVKRASSPLELWLKWAEVEEQRFQEPERAVKLLEQVVAADPERTDALVELSRLRAAAGDAKGAAAALRDLLPRTDAESRVAIELKLAGILIGSLDKPDEALDLAESVLQKHKSDADALRIVHQALGAPPTRARAAMLLERMAEGAEDPDARADVIEALLAVSAADPELLEARSRWMRQLLDTKLDEPEEALRLALRLAEAAPGEDELWTVAEEMARKLNRPDPVSEAYTRTIERELAPAVAEVVGRRVVEFQEEWFEDGERVIALLSRVLSLCPTADWAFDRLKLAFNAQSRYAELFELYDARLERDLSPTERVELLREAAMAARDFAGNADRAIDYFERLNRDNPGDQRVEASLERLYERSGKKRPLIELLSLRLREASAKPADQNELCGRVAALWLDLNEPAEALALAARLLAAPGGETDGVALLERIVALPGSESAAAEGAPSVRVAAARLLCQYYRSQDNMLDVVRMLEVEADGSPPAARVPLLDEAIELRLAVLGDPNGAFETLSVTFSLVPDDRKRRKRLAKLASELGLLAQRAEVLRAVALGDVSEGTRGSLLLEAGETLEKGLSDMSAAAEHYRGVLALGGTEPADALSAARALVGILRQQGSPGELASVLERLAELAPEADERRQVLGEAAEVALAKLGDPARAIVSLEARLKLGADDKEAVDALCKALERAKRFEELVVALERRAELSASDDAARSDRTRAAQLLSRALSDRPRAISAFLRVRELHGRSVELFDSLKDLLTEQQAFIELAQLYTDEVQHESDSQRQRQLYLELGGVHRHHTGELLRALEAFVVARDWERSIEVAGLQPADAALGLSVVERLRVLAVEAFSAEKAPEALAAASWAVQELCDRRLERGEFETVVSELLDAAKLPFAATRQRELRRDAAYLCADRLNDGKSAIQLFNELLAEEPGDEVAAACVTRLSLLLEEQGLHDEIVTLWESQAKARKERGDSAGAALLYARAGENAEQRLSDRKRAIVNHEAGATLGGEASLQALSRIFREQGDLPRAADALERLLLLDNSELIAERAMTLLAVYRELGSPERARPALERAARTAIEAQTVRAALGTLYRELSDHAALAQLLAEEAQRTPDRRQRIQILRDAAEIHLTKRNAPAEAAPLLEQAIELEPDDQKVRLRLAQALFLSAQYPEALGVLREQIQRYGARKPKDRAQAHFQLARVLLASGEATEALRELDAASKIDPAHPGIMQMLGRVAMEQGELDRAEKMFRSLMLVVGRDDDPEAASKTEALLSLSELSLQRGDEARAQELMESAFEASSESGREALALEAALRSRGRHDLLARALHSRLEQVLSPAEAAGALADLVVLHAEHLGGLQEQKDTFRERATVIERLLDDSPDRGGDNAWSALGRIYDHLGVEGAEARILEKRLERASSGAPPTDPDLYFRLARAKIASKKTVEEGLTLLGKALDLRLDPTLAQGVLADLKVRTDLLPKLASLVERVARALGDSRSLAEVLVIKLSQPGASPEALRELLSATSELGETGLLQRGLEAVLQNPTTSLSSRDLADARRNLAALYAQQGELGKSLDLREQSIAELPPEETRDLTLELARECASIESEQPRAVRLYQSLRAREPRARELWQPLLGLLRATGQLDAFGELLGQIGAEIEDPAERSQLRLERADLLLQRPGNEKEAIKVLFEVIGDDPSCISAVARLRELLVATGRDDELAELLSTELDRAKDQNDVPRVVGLSLEVVQVLIGKRQLDKALEVCQAALQWSPTEADLLQAALAICEKLGDPPAIANALEGLMKVKSGAEAAALGRRLAALREELGDREAAERALEASFSANPRDSSLRDLLIVRYTEREDYSKVAGLLNVSLRQRSGDARLLDRLVEAYRAADQPDAALSALETFTGAAGTDASLLRKRAQLLSELSRDEEAVAALEQAYAVDPSLAGDLIEALERTIARAEPPEDRRLTLRLAEMLEAAGDAHGARARLSELVRETPGDLDALRRLAELSTRTGNPDHAVETLTQLMEFETGEDLVNDALHLADACEQLGRLEDARSGLERALEVDRRRPDVRQRLQAIYRASGAVRELSEMLLEDANSAKDPAEQKKLLLRAAELLLASEGQAETAVQVLEMVRKQDPDNLEVVVLLARAYSGVRRSDDALALLTSVVEATKGRRIKAMGQIFQEMANLHLADGFLSDAVAALMRAFELDPKNGKLAMQVGTQALEIDEDEIAQRAFRGIAIMKPPEPGSTDGATIEMKADANYYLATLAKKAGDPRKAKVLASKALSENPDHEAARALLAEL